jgi:bifunctional non-homologous end joining protein LigD
MIARNRITGIVQAGHYYEHRFVEAVLLEALKSLRAKNFIIDGEIAALDENGKSSFQLLQSYGIRKNIPLIYYAFDLLSLEGTDVRDQPLLGRRKLLAQLLKNAPANIRFSEELQGSIEALLEIAHKFGLEGLVAKRLDSPYEPCLLKPRLLPKVYPY